MHFIECEHPHFALDVIFATVIEKFKCKLQLRKKLQSEREKTKEKKAKADKKRNKVLTSETGRKKKEKKINKNYYIDCIFR